MSAAREQWYRQPVVWVAAAILIASIVGCIHMIMLTSRLSDESMPVQGERVLKVPSTRDTAGS